jgi:hypothetical protein
MKTYLCSLLLLVFFKTTAQDIVFKYDKKFRNVAMLKSYSSFTTINESSGDLHLTIVDNKSVERFVLDSNWQIKKKLVTVRGAYAEFPYERFNSLQLLTDGDKEINIYNNDDNKFSVNQVDYDKQVEINIDKFELKRKESIITNFTTAGIFCLIVAGKREDELKFITNAKSHRTQLDTLLVRLNFKDPNMSVARMLSTVALITKDERDLKKLVEKNKIYFDDTLVYITIDQPDATYLTSIDLMTGQVKHNIFIQRYSGSLPEKNTAKKYNSFLYGNILVNGNTYNANLSLTFYDHQSENYIKNYTVSSADAIDFKTGPILTKKGKEITSADFFKKLNSGDALVFELSEKNKNELELIVEVCDITIPRSGGGGYWASPGGSFQTPGGAIPIAPRYHAFGNWTSDESIVTKNSSFRSALNAETFTASHTADTSKSISGLLEEELKKLDANSAISIFRKNGKVYLGFYDAKAEAFIIKRIGK